MTSTDTTKSSLTKVTCTRCGGSGKYSFNLLDGTMCYGCRGSGFQMRNLKKDAAAAARKAAKHEAELARRALNVSTLEEVIAELNPVYGPFDTDTLLGRDKLNYAVSKALGRGIYKIRDERVAEMSVLA